MLNSIRGLSVKCIKCFKFPGVKAVVRGWKPHAIPRRKYATDDDYLRSGYACDRIP